jgi:Tripartite tricarboxylate transporter TctB family
MSGDRPAHSSRTTAPLVQRIAPEIAVLAVCAVLLVVTGDLTTSAAGPGPAFYPRLLIGLLVLAMAVRIVQEMRHGARVRAGVAPERAGGEPSDFDPDLISDRRVWAATGFVVAYVLGSLYLGWPLATFVFVVGFLWAAGKRQLAVTVPVAAVVAVVFTYVFVKVVYMSLPTGVGVFDSLTVALYELLGIY